MFGLGVVSWLVLGSVIFGRLMVRPLVPVPLQPTLAIEVAPAAVASVAWFSLHGDRIDTVAALLAGYGLLMALAQLRLLPAFLRLRFMPGTWAFTFGWASLVTVLIHWLHDTRPAGVPVGEYLALAAITLFVGGIGVRTAVAVARRNLLPRPVHDEAHA
jgi:tellurite resistance protein